MIHALRVYAIHRTESAVVMDTVTAADTGTLRCDAYTQKLCQRDKIILTCIYERFSRTRPACTMYLMQGRKPQESAAYECAIQRILLYSVR